RRAGRETWRLPWGSRRSTATWCWCCSPTSSSTSGCPSKSARPARSTSLLMRSLLLPCVRPLFAPDMLSSMAVSRYKVFYPTLYAIKSENKDAKLFNCVQRGHQNSLEMMPVFFATLLVGGLQLPVIAAGLGAVYTVARFFYFKGYASGVPENRLRIGLLSQRLLPSGINFLALFGLIILTAAFAMSLILDVNMQSRSSS
ncbi:unnamed protein product, partial [Musa acuminata var. zebrina]